MTLEDLVEELVGEIRDEYDAAETMAGHDPANLDGGTTLEEFAHATGIQLDDGAYQTLAGYVIAQLGRLAEVSDVVAIAGGRLEVTATTGMRITTVAFTPVSTADAPTED